MILNKGIECYSNKPLIKRVVMIKKHLYFEPTIYVPYSLDLRNKNAIKLTKMWVENGQEVDILSLFDKFVRLPNKNYLKAQFKKPLHMEISKLVDTEGVITLHMQYEINFQDEDSLRVFHKQNLNFQSRNQHHKVINQYSSSMALPAMFGKEGLSLAKTEETHDASKTILQIGLLGEDKSLRTWCIETLNRLYPNTDLKHGVLH